MAFPVRGVPTESREILSVTKSINSWVVAGGGGLAESTANGWKALHPPTGGDVAIVLPFGPEFIAAGAGFCAAYQRGAWRDLAIDDNLYSGAESAGEILIAGRKSIYHISNAGVVLPVLAVSGESNYYCHDLRGELVVCAVDKGMLIWDRQKQRLIPSPKSTNWALGREVCSIQSLDSESLFIATSSGCFIEDSTGEHSVLAAISSGLVKDGLLGAYQINDTLIALTWKGGVTAFSTSDGRTLWKIPHDTQGGNFFFISKRGADLLVGSSNGLYVIPDPEHYSFSTLPSDDINFAGNFGDGVLVSFGNKGVFSDDGVSQNSGTIFSLVKFAQGDFIEGRWGKVVYHSEPIEVGGRDIDALTLIDSDTLAMLQPGIVSFLNLTTHAVKKLSLPYTPNSFVSTAGKKLLVGTSSGVLRFSQAGAQEASFGVGLSRVHAFRSGAVAMDFQGTLFDQTGGVLAKLPLTEMVDAVEWAGELCLLARAADGGVWVGLVKKNGWVPLDIPMPMVPQAIAVKGNQLLILGPGLAVKTSHPRLLDTPVSEALLADSSGRIFGNATASLASREDSVDLLLDAGRLDPWRNPTTLFRVGNGEWILIAPGARVPLARLSWGTTPIVLRSEWGGLAQEENLSVFRATPWWAGVPAIFVYLLALGGATYAIIRWRTWHLENRAEKLEAVVEQRTAQLRQAQQAREDFFSMMSHEIRNPLNGVVGLCEIVENAAPEAVAPRERMLLKTLRGCADQLRSILDDILDFSRIDRGEIQLNEETFELRDAVEGAARGVDASLKRCVLELPDEPHYLRGDCGKIRQVVTNLVSNALKYGVPPVARVLVQTERTPTNESLVCIRVLNTGSTIPADELEQIFQGYVRGEDARRRRIAGTGLGLAVSRRIALAMHGSLTAISANSLTEFRLDLRLPETTAPIEVAREVNRPKTSRALGVEDEVYNRLVLGSILGQLGYEVDWAVDGAEALAHARTGAYDLILTDFMLPDTTGTELAKNLLAILPEPKPPIIAVTAYSTPEKMQQAKEAGIVGFVTKPVSRKKIEAAILGAVGDFSAGRSIDVQMVDCNFSQLLRLPDGARKLAEYADDLPRAWTRVTSCFQQEQTPIERARTVHAFRSRLLAVHANSAEEQVALLEEAAQRGSSEDIAHLIAVVQPLLKELEAAARSRALTQST